jgi:hypothetical protein
MREDIDLLQGSWCISSLAMDGLEISADVFANGGIVVKGNRFTSIGMGRVANLPARHRSLLKAQLKLAGVPNSSVCEGFGF